MGMQNATGTSEPRRSHSDRPAVDRAPVWPEVASWLIDIGVIALCLPAANVGAAVGVALGAPLWVACAIIPIVLLLAAVALTWLRRSRRGSLGQRTAGLHCPADDEQEASVTAAAHPLRATVAAIVAMIAIVAGLFDIRVGPSWRMYMMPSTAMLPTLAVHDQVLVNRLYYRLRPVRRGDLVVFRGPAHGDRMRRAFLKRVVGVEGDTIEVREGQLYRNGEPVCERCSEHGADGSAPGSAATHEPYEIVESAGVDWAPHTVPPGHVFVFGDNRNSSNDSRRWRQRDADGLDEEAPALPIEDIQGKILYRLCPPDRIGVLR